MLGAVFTAFCNNLWNLWRTRCWEDAVIPTASVGALLRYIVQEFVSRGYGRSIVPLPADPGRSPETGGLAKILLYLKNCFCFIT
jgi:hypothetical protein